MVDGVAPAGPFAGCRLDGKADPQIVRELLELAKHPKASDERTILAVCDRYVTLLAEELESPDRRTRLFDGVSELLAALTPHEAAGRALVGLLTGNLERGAALKLRSAGLDPARFAVGAYGSGSGDRPPPPAVSARRAAERPRPAGRRGRGGVLRGTPAGGAGGPPARGPPGAGAAGAYRHREEWETRVTDPDAALIMLERLGFTVVLRIDRTIAEYRLGAATLRLEWYPAMDVLVEVEGAPEAIERAVVATGLPRVAFLPESLPHFVAAYERRTGRPARLAAEAR